MDNLINRKAEIESLNQLLKFNGLVVIFGRRRVGKTRLIIEWLRKHNGHYAQAIEGNTALQLSQIYADLSESLELPVEPHSWEDLFSLLEQKKGKLILCIDEFPYLAASDSSLPSRFQKWLDHGKKKDLLLVLSGSSTRMMHDAFLNAGAPLFGRALKIIQVKPMDYESFCEYIKSPPSNPESFRLFSFVGGIPKYWEWLKIASMQEHAKSGEIVETMYFSSAAWMDQEPQRLLADERTTGIYALSVIEAIGRGANRPVEIAARLGVAQTTLSKTIQQLLDASVVIKETPFGSGEKDVKKTLYCIADPMMRFWFSVFSSHCTRWLNYSAEQKREILESFYGASYENFIRQRFPGARRYWEKNLEFDMVREERGVLVVSEIKWALLSKKQKLRLERDLTQKFTQSFLFKKYSKFMVEIIDRSFLNCL